MCKRAFIFLLLQVSFFLSCNNDSFSDQPRAVKGALDLRNSKIDSRFFQKLEGEWEFYWKEFFEGEETSLQASFISVPDIWNSFEVDKKPVGAYGYATYRLTVLLPQEFRKEHPQKIILGLKLPYINTAFKLFVNGEFLTEVGRVGKNREEIIPRQFPQVVAIPNSKESLTIVFQVANFDLNNGGIWDNILLGEINELRTLRERNLLLDFFLFGGLFLIGVYHLGLFSLRRKDKSPLYFGIFCLLMAIRTLLIEEKYSSVLFPDWSWAFSIKLEYLTFYLGLPVITLFIESIFPNEFPKLPKRGILFFSGLFSLAAILPITIFVETLFYMQLLTLISIVTNIYVMLLAIQRKCLGAKSFFTGTFLFSLIIGNDLLHNMGIIHTGNFSHFGFLIFTFSQSYVLSMRFSVVFRQVEELSQNLEMKIQERTKDLEEMKQDIEEINNFTYIANSQTDLDSIFITISQFIFHRYHITATWLLLPNEKKEYLSAFKIYSYQKLSSEVYNSMMNTKIPLKGENGGMVSKTFYRKKPFYMSRIPKYEFEIDKKLIEMTNVKSFLYVPLLRKGESVGVLGFSNFDKELILSKKEIRKIANLCSQIAGAIDTNYLLQQVEKAKKATESLSLLIKKVNELSGLDEIMYVILRYVKEKFNFPYYSLFIINRNMDTLDYASSLLPDFVSKEHLDYFKNNSHVFMNLKNKDSVHAQAIKNGKAIFVPDSESGTISESGRLVLGVVNYKSFITLPIFLLNSPFGTLDFFSLEPVNLSQEEIQELSMLSEQLAGIIHGSLLLRQVQEEKEKVELQNREIEKLAESRKRLSLVGQMVAGIVHDIKNPIATIKALSWRLGLDTLSPQKREKNTKLIQKEMDRLNDLVYEILDFSKGKLILELKKINLENFLKEINSFLQADYEYASIESKMDLHYVDDVVVDVGRLRRVLVNLIKNAIEAMYDGKKQYFVKLTTELKEKNLVIGIEDNGPGLPEMFQSKIFEAFATEGKAKGTGLGLFMSKWIIEAHNGDLTYKTKTGEGTTFYITLPTNLKEEDKI